MNALTVHAPGRVNLIGDHTDYNDGFALPVALDLGTQVTARSNDLGLLRAFVPGHEDCAPVDDLDPRAGPEWTRYVRGVASLLRDYGCDCQGADLVIDSNLPIGAGLSSSASLELAVAVALSTLAGETLDRRTLARLGQRVENEIVGVHSGIMDQLAVAYGRAGHALLIDCRSSNVTPVALPDDVRILVLDTAAPRTLHGSAYNTRRTECESALRALQRIDPTLRALRDATPALVDALEGVARRRARHVISENGRVLDAAAALRAGAIDEFGRLMTESHMSLRDDYRVSSPELDTMVELALDTDGVLGARMTGAGFGGCAVAVVTHAAAGTAADTITTAYRHATGHEGRAIVCSPSNGVEVIASPRAATRSTARR
jgi:galactokinase